MKASNAYLDAVKDIPKEIKKQTQISFAIADRLQAILSERGLTQKAFARKIGKTEAEVSVWLSGQHNFTIKTIAKISSILDEDIISIP